MAETQTAQQEAPETNQTTDQKESQQQNQAQAQEVDFPEAGQSTSTSKNNSIDILLEMNVPVTVAIGKTEMPVRKLLQLGPGSVLKLDKSIDAPADLYVKNTKFATGHVVVVEGRFAIRIKQILGLGNVPDQNQQDNNS